MNRLRLLSLILTILITASATALSAEIRPVEPKKTDKCPVCGMFVAKYKNWTAEVIYRDGSYAVFDGPKDMFKYYLNQDKYRQGRTPDIAAVYVTEYYSTKLKDARKMYYVTGSDIYGPMGDELIPLSSEREAREFMNDHKGSRILKFQEVTNEILR